MYLMACYFTNYFIFNATFFVLSGYIYIHVISWDLTPCILN